MCSVATRLSGSSTLPPHYVRNGKIAQRTSCACVLCKCVAKAQNIYLLDNPLEGAKTSHCCLRLLAHVAETLPQACHHLVHFLPAKDGRNTGGGTWQRHGTKYRHQFQVSILGYILGVCWKLQSFPNMPARLFTPAPRVPSTIHRGYCCACACVRFSHGSPFVEGPAKRRVHPLRLAHEQICAVICSHLHQGNLVRLGGRGFRALFSNLIHLKEGGGSDSPG